MTKTNVVVHENPVWRDRANFIIATSIEDENDNRWRWEQLWARQIDANHFEICCIPFFAYDLALGDEVETGPAEERQYVVQRVVKLSGHYAFRVWFKDTAAREQIPKDIEDLGCLMEWQFLTANLLAIDAENSLQAQQLADILWEKEQQGLLVYETAR